MGRLATSEGLVSLTQQVRAELVQADPLKVLWRQPHLCVCVCVRVCACMYLSIYRALPLSISHRYR